MIIECRISDDEQEEFPVRRLLVDDERVVHAEDPPGLDAYFRVAGFPEEGWTTAEVEAWTRYDGTGTYPESYHEVRMVRVEGGREVAGPWTTFASIHAGELDSPDVAAPEGFEPLDLGALDLGGES